jgi:ATP-binding cassette subfamily B protein
MVLQDTWLFNGTIYDNLAYGRPTATREEVLAAAKAAYVDRFVHSLPDGYDTVLDGETAAVSAGEKQLLTIARAFLSDPSILILDEATSSVDTRTEVLIQNATVILVMENGAIVEQGSHEELLAARGAYHRLYRSQFTAPVGEGA